MAAENHSKLTMMWIIAIGLLGVGAGAFVWFQSAGDRPDVPLTLVVSGDTAGWIVPCGCTSNQSGGLPRRASLIHELKAQGSVIVADVGGAPGGTSPYDRTKFAAILAGERALGVSAHNIGGAEAALGSAELRQLAAQHDTPFVSANVRDTSGELVAPPLRIVHQAGRRVALVGVLDPRYAAEELRVSDPAAAVLAALADVRGAYDALVVLAYLPTEALQALAEGLPEADLVIGGPTRQSIPPRRVGATMLASVTNKGKFVAQFEVPPPGIAQPWHGTVVEVTGKYEDDREQLTLLDEFRQQLAKRDFMASETSFVPALPAEVPSGYHVAGTASCHECHTDDCRTWEGSQHAQAWNTLSKQQAFFDSYCQQCHTTAYGLPGGFVSAKRSRERIDVGCESCHGPSQSHAQRPSVRTTFVARDQCIHCHDRENSPQFAYNEYWQQIVHGLAANDPTAGPKGNLPLRQKAATE